MSRLFLLSMSLSLAGLCLTAPLAAQDRGAMEDFDAARSLDQGSHRSLLIGVGLRQDLHQIGLGLTNWEAEGVRGWLKRSGLPQPNSHAMESRGHNDKDHGKEKKSVSTWNAHARHELRYAAAAEIPSQVVPEPATLVLLGTGLVGVVGLAWRRKRDEESVQ